MTDPFLVALANCPAIGARSLEKLFARFSSGEAIWSAPEDEFRDLDLGQKRLEAFLLFRKSARPDAYVTLMEQNDIRIITKQSAEYPSLLKTIFDPPFILFLKGAQLREPSVAIVGSRKATDYGKKAATGFAKTLAQRGISVVSGLAEGIDTAAYKGALEGEGHTVAILGGGLLQRNSLEKEASAREVLSKNGTLISEFSLHGGFASYHFPMRNRIIAGMSRLTVIVEAALPSGSLTTAKAALEAGRDVFAVPGPIDSPMSAGTNNLLKDGAFVATSADDIFLALDMAASSIGESQRTQSTSAKAIPSLPPFSAELYRHLEKGPLFADELTLRMKASPSSISTGLLELELLGIVRHLGGTRYELT